MGIFALAEAESILGLCVYSLALPLLLGYFLERTHPAGGGASALVIPGAMTLALGGPLAQVGYDWLKDTYLGRKALIQTVAPGSSVYLYARLAFGALESLLIAASYLTLLILIGSLRLKWADAFLIMALVAAGSLALCSLGAFIADSSKSLEKGTAMVGIATMALGLVSPVLYPIEALPWPIQWLARLSPFTGIASILRVEFESGTVSVPVFFASILQFLLLHGLFVFLILRGPKRTSGND